MDFNETGTVMADMALNILGADGGKFAVLSASPDAANQNAWIAAMKEALKDPKYAKLELLDIVYGNDQSEDELQPGAGAGGQVPRHEADHGADHGRHRGGGQGHAGRGSVRQGQGLRPGPADRDGRPTPRTAARPSSPCGASSTWAT